MTREKKNIFEFRGIVQCSYYTRNNTQKKGYKPFWELAFVCEYRKSVNIDFQNNDVASINPLL